MHGCSGVVSMMHLGHFTLLQVADDTVSIVCGWDNPPNCCQYSITR